MNTKLIILFLVLFSLTSCERQSTRSTFLPLVLSAIDNHKNGDITPISIRFNSPMIAGDILTVTHKENTIATITLSSNLKLELLHIRIRALGDGKVSAILKRKGKATLYAAKDITVNKYSAIPKHNKTKLKTHSRTKDGSYKMLIMNDSSEFGFVKKVDIDFGHGSVIVIGSKYLSLNPYFLFKPIKLGKKPITTITLDNALSIH